MANSLLRCGISAVFTAVLGLLEVIRCRSLEATLRYVERVEAREHEGTARSPLCDGESRIAFAFDPKRHAILLADGSRSGLSERQFYKDLIRVADMRFTAHLNAILSKARGRK